VIYFCCQEDRRALIRGRSDFNGIDFLEVVDHEQPLSSERQRLLRVFFVNPPTGQLSTITAQNIVISGGERITFIGIDSAIFAADGHLEVHVTPRGDFSQYTLTISTSDGTSPLPGMDPALSSVGFSFKVECDTQFDCQPACSCTRPTADSPEIDYMAKDYASFRQLVLDRLAFLMPEWQESNPADLGITLVELLAYVGDQLSYRQDAIATEAYLGTARLRTSVRRHAQMLNYAINDGCNARVWMQVRIKANAPGSVLTLPPIAFQDSTGNVVQAPDDTPILTFPPVLHTRFATEMPGESVLDAARFSQLVQENSPKVFELMESAKLHRDHNEMSFYTWSDADCCLPKGAVKATLKGSFPNLEAGFVLILKEIVGPETGNPADADPAHRHAVRLISVTPGTDVVTGDEITEIEWSAEDALPFPLCISSIVGNVHVSDVSIALGNIVLADHGMTIDAAESLGQVPEVNSALLPVGAGACGHCDDIQPAVVVPRYRPRLEQSPLTQVFPPPNDSESAASVFAQDKGPALPAIVLQDDRGTIWLPRSDLLSSDQFATEFVAEVENDLSVRLRFGDGNNGVSAESGASFEALYRIGNGASGNVGADSITRVTADTIGKDAQWIESVTNPLPASGGAEPETLEDVRQYAPAAFRTQLRAVTPDDYATFAQMNPQVQRAAATLRWTGSWYSVFLAVDRIGGKPIDDAFKETIQAFLEPYRMAGQDLEIDGPQYVSIELTILVCIDPHYFRADVLEALSDLFSSGIRADGTLGFFHPDRFTFNQPIYLSQIYAAAQNVPGVRHIEVDVLQRQGNPSTAALDTGKLDIGRLEIARLSNDRDYPDHGILTFIPRGGR